MRKIRLAIVDDSSFIRRVLERLFTTEPRIEVVGSAASGEELLTHLEEWRPDVITLDLSMPGMGGLPTLDHLMARRPTPVIILSTHSSQDAPQTIEALHRGAMDFIDKQRYSLADARELRAVLVEKILQADRHPPPRASPAVSPAAEPPLPEPESRRLRLPAAHDLLVLGASTGGPQAIETILQQQGRIGVPIAVVQHMPREFTRAFAERLNARLPFPVHEAADGEALLPGTVYVAPGGRHLRVADRDGRLYAELSTQPADAPHHPSVDVLFTSAARARGDRVVGVLLTGMGDDGAQGMQELARAGALTIAQDETTSVVFGMPRAALKRRAVEELLALPEIGPRLRGLLGVRSRVGW